MIPYRIPLLVLLALASNGCSRPAPSGNSLATLDNDLIDSAEAAASESANGSARDQSTGSGDDCHAGGRSGACTAPETVQAPGCGKRFTLGLSWATRLPAGLELYPGAKVIESAGDDQGDCHVRIVSYVSDASVAELVDWYQGAGRAGFTTDHVHSGREDVVSGTRQPQGDAFRATIAPDASGSTVDLIVNHGS